MPALMPRIWTAAEVQALPDDPSNRYECVDGVLLVSPSPRTLHQSAVTELALLLGPLVRSAGVGAIVCAPSDWVLDPRTDEKRGHPLLFIEILSPSTARFDRVVKRDRYQRAEWQPAGADAPFVIALEPFFAEVLGPA